MGEPPRFATIEVYLTVGNGFEAVEFYRRAFGAEVVFQELTEDAKRIMHASLAAYGGHIMLSDYFPEHITDVAPRDADAQASITVQVNLPSPADVDAAIERAVAAGATVTMPVWDTFWVMRYGRVKDPFGYVWAFSAPLPLAI